MMSGPSGTIYMDIWTYHIMSGFSKLSHIYFKGDLS